MHLNREVSMSSRNPDPAPHPGGYKNGVKPETHIYKDFKVCVFVVLHRFCTLPSQRSLLLVLLGEALFLSLFSYAVHMSFFFLFRAQKAETFLFSSSCELSDEQSTVKTGVGPSV